MEKLFILFVLHLSVHSVRVRGLCMATSQHNVYAMTCISFIFVAILNNQKGGYFFFVPSLKSWLLLRLRPNICFYFSLTYSRILESWALIEYWVTMYQMLHRSKGFIPPASLKRCPYSTFVGVLLRYEVIPKVTVTILLFWDTMSCSLMAAAGSYQILARNYQITWRHIAEYLCFFPVLWNYLYYPCNNLILPAVQGFMIWKLILTR
jgi:hypothetical protein